MCTRVQGRRWASCPARVVLPLAHRPSMAKKALPSRSSSAEVWRRMASRAQSRSLYSISDFLSVIGRNDPPTLLYRAVSKLQGDRSLLQQKMAKKKLIFTPPSCIFYSRYTLRYACFWRRAVAAVKQFPRRDLWTNREAYGILIYKRARILAGCRKPETGFFRAPGLCAGGGRCKKEIVWH